MPAKIQRHPRAMSLINRMLQDLDRRHASAARKDGLPINVRALPATVQAPRWAGWVAAAIAFAAAAGGAAWWIQAGAAIKSGPDEPRAQNTTQPSSHGNSPAANPTPEPVAAVNETLKPQSTRMADTRDPAPATSTQAATADPASDLPPQAAQAQGGMPSDATREAVQSAPLRRPSAASSELVAHEPVKVVSAPQVSDIPRVEKQVRLATPRDRAEHEYRRATTAAGQGRNSEAIQHCRAALREDAGYAAARRLLASLLVEDGRGNEAIVLLQEGLEQDSHQPGLATTLARLLAERGDTSGALEVMQRSAPAAAIDAEFRGLHGALLQRVERHADALDEYRAALRLLPSAGAWRIGLGISLEALGRVFEAREAFAQARTAGNLSPELIAYADQKLQRLPRP